MTEKLSDITARFETNKGARAFIHLARATALGAHAGEVRSILEHDLPSTLKSAVGAPPFDYSASAPSWAAAFLDGTSRRTILGRLPVVALPPFVNAPILATSGSAAFVPAGDPIPCARLDVDLVNLGTPKIALLVAWLKDLLRLNDERVITLLGRQLGRLIVAGEDTALLSDTAASGGVPAGLLAGVSSVGAGSPADLAADVAALWDAVRAGNPEAPYFVTSPRGAMYLRQQADDNSGSLFREINVATGGTLAGAPVLLSAAAQNRLVLIDGANIGVSDGGLTVDAAPSASVLLDDAPSAGAGSQVSAFQTGTVLLRLTRHIDWALGAADAIGFLDLPIDASPA